MRRRRDRCEVLGCDLVAQSHRTICYAHELDRMPEPVDAFRCEWCDEPMYGAHRRWCSDTCRAAAHQQRTTWSRALERYWDQAS